MQMLSTNWIQKTAIALVLCLYGSAAGAYDLMDSVMTSAWKNRDVETIDQARSLGWDFGTFLEKTIEKQLAMIGRRVRSIREQGRAGLTASLGL